VIGKKQNLPRRRGELEIGEHRIGIGEHLEVKLNPEISGVESAMLLSGVDPGRGGTALNTVKCPVESARRAGTLKPYAQL